MQNVNPFDLKPMKKISEISDWKKLSPKPYDTHTVDPYTRVRMILMNGTEFESVKFLHCFHRHCNNNDLRRELAFTRRIEQQQQKRIASLKPTEEDILKTTIGYEQLAVDLTAIMAQREPDATVKAALDFALLEDFDHLYRFADLLEMEHGVEAERLVGNYTEIMPGRPTVAEHRFPFEAVNPFICSKIAAPITKLHVNIITAAEQQTMNYYMNIGQFYSSKLGRSLYNEIAMIEEQHVSEYGSLIDPNCTWLESLLMHEYVECYLYYSCFVDETDPAIKRIWEMHFEQEVEHLHTAVRLLDRYEGKPRESVIPDGVFPALILFTGNKNKDYVRKVLKSTVTNTKNREEYIAVSKLPSEHEFFTYQSVVNKEISEVPSHAVIVDYLAQKGQDYRVQDSEHPVKELQDRTTDNVTLAR
ncbi:MAG: hypothetical protein IJF71_03575 [Clostridia bacterium]|nr:hypothetical protein [Clostridia bacterium]